MAMETVKNVRAKKHKTASDAVEQGNVMNVMVAGSAQPVKEIPHVRLAVATAIARPVKIVMVSAKIVMEQVIQHQQSFHFLAVVATKVLILIVIRNGQYHPV